MGLIDRRGEILTEANIPEDVISGHQYIAAKYFPQAQFPEYEAFLAGWIFIGSCVINGAYINIQRDPTEGQWEALADLGLLNSLYTYDLYSFERWKDC